MPVLFSRLLKILAALFLFLFFFLLESLSCFHWVRYRSEAHPGALQPVHETITAAA